MIFHAGVLRVKLSVQIYLGLKDFGLNGAVLKYLSERGAEFKFAAIP
jgi:hypothetical protein